MGNDLIFNHSVQHKPGNYDLAFRLKSNHDDFFKEDIVTFFKS